MTTCPCCGQETNQPSLDSLKWLLLTRTEREILDKLVAEHPRKLSGEQLTDWLYRDRADGGPLSGRRTVDVHLFNLRKKIAATGWWVGRHGYGEGVGLHFVGGVKTSLSRRPKPADRLASAASSFPPLSTLPTAFGSIR